MAGASNENRFWDLADALVAAHDVVIDRPAGSVHPRLSHVIYPLDYGYLAGTGALDGAGVDIWRGSLVDERVTAVIATVDLVKRDAEVKLLIGCTPAEAALALSTHRQGLQGGVLLWRDGLTD